ncbi:hypothetical protein Musp01_24720 [Muricauda sp. NBRC 101325]|nr:hypothetical protein Musp01_24720 [Muricauda sp. NBRC 101325]
MVAKDGQIITGLVSSSLFSFRNNFKFYDDSNNSIRIKAKDYESMTIERVHYKVFKNENGKEVFMKQLVDSGKASLYADEIELFDNLGHRVLSEYYLMKNGNLYYMDIDKLRNYPERYFGGATDLLDEIRNTKIKHYRSKIHDWVLMYNQTI